MRAMAVATLRQAHAAFGCQRVEPGLAIVGGHTPLGADPFPRFQALQGRIQRSMIHQKNILGIQLNAAGDALPVPRAENQDTQDEKIERPLQQRDAILFFRI